jgi:hypothetical protein
MRRHLLALSALLIAANARSQVQVGVKAGLNLAHVSSNETMIENHKKTWATLQGGLVLDFSASEHFSFQPHLLLMGKGTRWETDSLKGKYRFVSLDIPLNLLYRSNGFFIGGGPNLGFNLDASSKIDGITADIGIGTDDDEVRRFDFGLNFMAGYQTDFGLVVGVNYLRGLSNIDNTPDGDWRNHAFGITLGYLIGERSTGKKD